jgi:hypothetical protein
MGTIEWLMIVNVLLGLTWLALFAWFWSEWFRHLRINRELMYIRSVIK